MTDLRSGIMLDIGCGDNKQQGFVGMDIRDLPGVDVVHDFEVFPWPLEDESVLTAVASHVVEHVNPHKFGFVNFMDEAWRVLKLDGQFAMSMPYGRSDGFYQDPTHCNPMNEACVTPDTEVLTRDGFKSIVDIRKVDHVLSLNPDTLCSSYVNNCGLVSYDHNGKMIYFSGRALDIVTNENHRVWYSTRKTLPKWRIGHADDFLKLNPDVVVFSSELNWKGKKIQYCEIPIMAEVRPKTTKIKDQRKFEASAFFEFMGWYLSEGSTEVTEGRPSYFRIWIAQRNPENKQRIAKIVERMGFKPNIRPDHVVFSAFHLSRWLKRFGHSRDKYIPRSMLMANVKLLEKMLETLILGDGHRYKTQIQYATTSEKLSNDVQELMMKCGYRASVCRYKLRDHYIWKIHASRGRPIYAKEFKDDYYKGTVHSLAMPTNHIYLARKQGKCVWTGNTFQYFDPRYPLYEIYRPKPWRIEVGFPVWQVTGNMEVLMTKVELNGKTEGEQK